MEGVPALPWAGDAGGRIILPKAVTYEQLAAGAVEFQLYNRNTNALIPTDILRVGDHIEIREKETGGDESPYTIDRYDGARSEIVLTGDGQATRIWGLMGASFNDSVHSIRTFAITRENGPDSLKFVYVEVDGKMYIPYILDGSDHVPVADVDGHFELMADNTYIVGNTVFPYLQVELEDDPNLGEGAIMKVPSIDNVTTEARHCIEVFYKAEYQNDYPWRYGQDGIFYLDQGWAIRVSGIWHAIVMENKCVNIDQSDHINLYDHAGGIYTAQNPKLIMDATVNEGIQEFKQDAEETYGITFGDDIEVAEAVDGDDPQPFSLKWPA